MKKKPFSPCLEHKGHGMLMKLFCNGFCPPIGWLCALLKKASIIICGVMYTGFDGCVGQACSSRALF